jgi:hypothetical protein
MFSWYGPNLSRETSLPLLYELSLQQAVEVYKVMRRRGSHIF